MDQGESAEPDWLLERERLERQIATLHQALSTRDVIGQAKGIVRLLHRCDDSTAFAILSKTSQYANVKLRDLAETVATAAGDGQPLPAQIASALHRATHEAASRTHDQKSLE